MHRAVFAILSLGATGCGGLLGAERASGHAAIVRARATSSVGMPLAEGCEAGSSLDGLPAEVHSLGARAVRVPDRPGLRLRLTLRFQDVESTLPENADPDDDRPYCESEYIESQRSRPVPAGCHAALHVVGSDPPAEVTKTRAIVEGGREVGFVLDVTVHHAGVLRVRSGPPCPLRDTYDLLTIGDPPPEPSGREPAILAQ